MSIAGLAVMNPITTMAMVDTSRWRPVVYADTPRTLALYSRFIADKKPEARRAVLFLFGALNLPKVAKDRSRFSSVLVFDDLQNLHQLTTQIDGFELVDVKVESSGALYPKYLSPMDLAEILDRQASIPSPVPLLTQVTNALGRRRPSVLENTSRLPLPEAVPESGAQRMLADLKAQLDDGVLAFGTLLDFYTKYLFRIVERGKLTSTITKRLPEQLKLAWKTALDFADSDIGKSMAHAYKSLCESGDPDYRVSHAVNAFDLKAYAGDFLYFTAVLPPHRTCVFVEGFGVKLPTAPVPLMRKFKPKPEPETAKKPRQKRARSRA